MIKIKNKYDGVIKRGDIFWCVFNYSICPILVVQNDIGNKYSKKTIIVKLNSSELLFEKEKRLPILVKIDINDVEDIDENHSKKFDKVGFALASELYTIDKSILIDKIGVLKANNFYKIDKALKISLGIEA